MSSAGFALGCFGNGATAALLVLFEGAAEVCGSAAEGAVASPRHARSRFAVANSASVISLGRFGGVASSVGILDSFCWFIEP
jgi:hypothetical protein